MLSLLTSPFASMALQDENRSVHQKSMYHDGQKLFLQSLSSLTFSWKIQDFLSCGKKASLSNTQFVPVFFFNCWAKLNWVRTEFGHSLLCWLFHQRPLVKKKCFHFVRWSGCCFYGEFITPFFQRVSWDFSLLLNDNLSRKNFAAAVKYASSFFLAKSSFPPLICEKLSNLKEKLLTEGYCKKRRRKKQEAFS